MMTFIAEWTANFAATLWRTFRETWTPPHSQIGYWTLVQPFEKLLWAHIPTYMIDDCSYNIVLSVESIYKNYAVMIISIIIMGLW